jgi:hypothetical protein
MPEIVSLTASCPLVATIEPSEAAFETTFAFSATLLLDGAF